MREFLEFAKEYRVKPLIGSRIFINSGFLYLFIKNRKGYENLCQILTFYAFERLTLQFIKEHSAGITLVSNSIKMIDELAPFFSKIYFLLLPDACILPEKRIPVIGANEIFYVHKQERILYRLLSVIKKFNPEDTGKIPYYLVSPEQFKNLYYFCPEVIKNLSQFAAECDYMPSQACWVFPESKKNLLEIINAQNYNLNTREKQRLAFEYRIIKEMGFEPYFVLIYELKEFAKARGIGMNVRGSAAASFILYLLGISVVNPLKYNLPFERFLNQKRKEPPDIDVDVEYNQREHLLKEIYKKFGSDYVARISMINRFQTRARFRDTARACGLSPTELKNIRNHTGEKLFDKIVKLSEKIDNYPHYFSCHPSGIVITPEPVSNYVPLFPSIQGAITHFDKDGIGIAGLVKLDILGVRGFPELYLRKESIDFQDAFVYKFIGEAKTIGCFQIESPMVRQVIKRIKPKDLMDIANAIAIIRPGPAHGGMKERFLKRLAGEEPVDYTHSVLKEILKETLGIPVYQEQILNMASLFAGFSLEDADLLRRAITKERHSELIDQIKDRFFIQAGNLGFSKQEIEGVWKRISAFSSFGFNKAHSITYATLAYLSAYQKLYDPLEFFCRLINNQGGYYPVYAYINEARRWGIKISGPDINQSDIEFSIKNGYLLTGFKMIRNLSYPTIQKIIKLRPFTSVHQFFSLVKPAIEEGTSLIKSGALDLFNEPLPKLYFELLRACSRMTHKNISECQQFFIRDDFSEVCFSDFNHKTKLKTQFSALGFVPAYHILELLYPERQTKICDIHNKRKTVKITGLIIAKRPILTKQRKIISFCTVDDETGILDTTLFVRGYKNEPGLPIIKIMGYVKGDMMYGYVAV